MNTEKIRKDFPILARKINGKQLVYLDNAATTQKPWQVIKAVSDYYEKHNANVHRAVHTLSAEATEIYEEAHEKTAGLIGAKGMPETVFTKNATESLNIIANSFARTLKKNDEIVLSRMEHHSNLVPWQIAARISGAKIRFIEIDELGEIDIESANKTIGKKTKIVSISHASNV